MHRVLLLGAGKIGRMIARLLVQSGDYQVTIGDRDAEALERLRQQIDVPTVVIDAEDPEALRSAMQDSQSVISALSYRFNEGVATAALASGVNYFDLTEDIATTNHVRRLAEAAKPNQIFMPQCGLAPGFISIVAQHLTWSTDGLINEYCNLCEAIHDGRRIEVLPLEGLEHFSLDGVRYEAFNTSGGLGTLCETLDGRVRELNYKTIRYLGHRDLSMFLVDSLRLGEKRELLKEILESAIPITFQDVVVIFCTVTGQRNGQYVQISDARKIYQQTIDDEPWSAIQITTAAGLCAVLDLHVTEGLAERGLVRQEQVDLEVFLNNRFGTYYQSQISTKFSSGQSDLSETENA